MKIRPTVLATALGLARPTAAQAQERRWSLDLELGGGTTLRDFDHDEPSASTSMITGAARVGFAPIPALTVQLGMTCGRFIRERRDLPLAGATLGLRTTPWRNPVGRLWFDLDAAVFLPGTAVSPGLDAAAGFAFDLGPTVSLGPFVRYAHAFGGRAGYATSVLALPANADPGDDIAWWSAGISVSIHLQRRAPDASRPIAHGRELR